MVVEKNGKLKDNKTRISTALKERKVAYTTWQGLTYAESIKDTFAPKRYPL